VHTFADRPTGYECFDSAGSEGDSLTNQWDFEAGRLIINSQVIVQDFNKLRVSPSPVRSPDFDYRCFADGMKSSLNLLSPLPIDGENVYINIYAAPYCYVMEDDIESLAEYLNGHNNVETYTTLTALALIHDTDGLLDLLIT
jgi:hypothetical protein